MAFPVSTTSPAPRAASSTGGATGTTRTAATGTTGTTGTTDSSDTGSKLGKAAGMGKDDFLTLLVAQLKNQDPMKPMEDREFVTQLAQFSSLEALEKLNTKLEALAGAQLLGEAAGLIGKQVDAKLPDGTLVSGVVSRVNMIDGKPLLVVGTNTIALDLITNVGGTAAPTTGATTPTTATAPAPGTTPTTGTAPTAGTAPMTGTSPTAGTQPTTGTTTPTGTIPTTPAPSTGTQPTTGTAPTTPAQPTPPVQTAPVQTAPLSQNRVPAAPLAAPAPRSLTPVPASDPAAIRPTRP